MKIYFAGSIRAGRDDAELYRRIIEHLRKYGQVLTEHVGDPNLSAEGQDGPSDKYIHDRDVAWLLSADAVVAEVTVPSLGVGYELATAVREGIPAAALFRTDGGKRLSAMIAGCGGVKVIEYSGAPESAFPALDTFLKEIEPR